MYSPIDFERIPTVDAGNLVSGDRILFGPVKRPRAAVKPPADSVPVEIVLGDELELIGCRIDALPTGSQALQLTLGWRGLRPATEDWTAFFHITPNVSNASLWGSWTMQSLIMSIRRRCELPIPDCRQCAFSAFYACQQSANTKQTRSLT